MVLGAPWEGHCSVHLQMGTGTPRMGSVGAEPWLCHCPVSAQCEEPEHRLPSPLPALLHQVSGLALIAHRYFYSEETQMVLEQVCSMQVFSAGHTFFTDSAAAYQTQGGRTRISKERQWCNLKKNLSTPSSPENICTGE